MLREPETRRGEIARIILAAVGVSGLVVVGAVAPGLLGILPLILRRRFSKKSIDQSVERLKRKGWLKLMKSSAGWRLELTDQGQAEILAWELGQKFIKPPKKWDKKWRLLIFDIPESRKNLRNQVRQILIGWGFCRLQDSVWAYPYECEDVLELLRAKYRVRHEALYLRAEKIAKDRGLKLYFGLG